MLVAGHLARWALAAMNVNCPEYLLGVSRWGMFNGMLWQPFTYLFLHELQSPWPLAATVGGLLLAGREFESVLGRRHFIGLSLTANALGGIAHILSSPSQLVFGAHPAVCALVLGCTTMLPECPLWLPVRTRLRLPYKYFGLALVLTLSILACRAHVPSAHTSAVADLLGAVSGWGYVRYLGFGGGSGLERWWSGRRSRRLRFQSMSRDQFMREEVDPVLEKINREGIKSLNRAERAVLRYARQKLLDKLS